MKKFSLLFLLFFSIYAVNCTDNTPKPNANATNANANANVSTNANAANTNANAANTANANVKANTNSANTKATNANAANANSAAEVTAPTYPDALRKAKVEGVVTLIFVLDETGRVEDPRRHLAERPLASCHRT